VIVGSVVVGRDITDGRNNPDLFKDTMRRLLNSPKMEFKELVGKEA
jgi:hypothetical protein